jgi:hypothetical protein
MQRDSRLRRAELANTLKGMSACKTDGTRSATARAAATENTQRPATHADGQHSVGEGKTCPDGYDWIGGDKCARPHTCIDVHQHWDGAKCTTF